MLEILFFYYKRALTGLRTATFNPTINQTSSRLGETERTGRKGIVFRFLGFNQVFPAGANF